MGKVTFKGWAAPDDPIYTEAGVQIGARMTQPSALPVDKDQTTGVATDATSQKSPDGDKQSLLELALSKGFTIADPNDPIYTDGLIVSVSPVSPKRETAAKKKGTNTSQGSKKKDS